ncbi:hypothetical protein [Amycolatopsis sp. WQ 127309]|uniref:hypothetical protein n=1 Tax=Amycolatopsis sp. WQ 127309 TaxID=2932773 RepID=UPI001FF2E404|nr:hypothetical protein [Amycolatopsis sp. WQ 127309]UOZ02928.1 hypothetical protein MUY22_29170 [Amycolatopsis sp. WQ 127309]
MRGRTLLPAVLVVLALDTPVPAEAATPACAWSWRTVSVRRIGTTCVPGPQGCVRAVVTTTAVFDVAAFRSPEDAGRRR